VSDLLRIASSLGSNFKISVLSTLFALTELMINIDMSSKYFTTLSIG